MCLKSQFIKTDTKMNINLLNSVVFIKKFMLLSMIFIIQNAFQNVNNFLTIYNSLLIMNIRM